MSEAPQIIVSEVRELLVAPHTSPVLYLKQGPDDEGGEWEVAVWAAAYVSPAAVVTTYQAVVDAIGEEPSSDEILDYLPELQELLKKTLEKL